MADQCACAIYKRALSLHAEGFCKQAVLEVIRFAKTHADHGPSWELLGILLFAQDKLKWAQSAIERASILAPLTARGQIVLAKCYERAGFDETASAIYRHLATGVHLEPSLLEPLACGLGARGEFELALHVCRTAARQMPDNPEPFIGIVHYMRRLGRPPEHILPVMYRAYYLEPRSAEYRIMLAWLLHESGNSCDAAKLLAQVPCSEFNCVHCLIRMQHIFELTGYPDDADTCRRRLEALASERRTSGDSMTHDEPW